MAEQPSSWSCLKKSKCRLAGFSGNRSLQLLTGEMKAWAPAMWLIVSTVYCAPLQRLGFSIWSVPWKGCCLSSTAKALRAWVDHFTEHEEKMTCGRKEALGLMSRWWSIDLSSSRSAPHCTSVNQRPFLLTSSSFNSYCLSLPSCLYLSRVFLSAFFLFYRAG